MHPRIKNVFDKEYMRIQDLRFALKKAFDILGNMYAPIFFCAACLMGISLPVLAWKTGGVINALLGARGVGVITNELSQGMWVMVIALAIFFASHLALARLEGKMHAVFASLAHIAETLTLLVILVAHFGVFLVHAIMITAWHLVEDKRVRAIIATTWFLGLVWMFFSLATDVALRVSTLGDMGSLVALCTLLYCTTTKKFFQEG